tara:strand:+ start:5589 stop:6476 length:888 start_codon:yes stop_codon:yes gene_type:complete
MIKIFNWILLSNKNKFRSLVTHFFKAIFNFIYFKDPKIINNVLFNNLISKFKYSENKNESFIVFSKDGGISRQLYVNGEYNLVTFKKTINIVGRLDLVLDVGANIGSTCIPSIKRNYTQKAIAIEADEVNFNLLKVNILLNGLEKKISAYNYLVSDKKKKFKLIKNKNNYGANYFIESKSSNKFENQKRIILNNFVNQMKNLKCLVWIDTQGHEPYVIQGATKLIKLKIPFVIEFTPRFFKRLKNETEVIKSIKKFKFFYDLYDKRKKTRVSEDSIQNLFIKYKNSNTEILLTNF